MASLLPPVSNTGGLGPVGVDSLGQRLNEKNFSSGFNDPAWMNMFMTDPQGRPKVRILNMDDTPAAGATDPKRAGYNGAAGVPYVGGYPNDLAGPANAYGGGGAAGAVLNIPWPRERPGYAPPGGGLNIPKVPPVGGPVGGGAIPAAVQKPQGFVEMFLSALGNAFKGGGGMGGGFKYTPSLGTPGNPDPRIQKAYGSLVTSPGFVPQDYKPEHLEAVRKGQRSYSGGASQGFSSMPTMAMNGKVRYSYADTPGSLTGP